MMEFESCLPQMREFAKLSATLKFLKIRLWPDVLQLKDYGGKTEYRS